MLLHELLIISQDGLSNQLWFQLLKYEDLLLLSLFKDSGFRLHRRFVTSFFKHSCRWFFNKTCSELINGTETEAAAAQTSKGLRSEQLVWIIIITFSEDLPFLSALKGFY